jgi:hypothetical protein
VLGNREKTALAVLTQSKELTVTITYADKVTSSLSKPSRRLEE